LLVFPTKTGAIGGARERTRESTRDPSRESKREREREFCVQFSLIGKALAEREFASLLVQKQPGNWKKKGKSEGKFKFEHTSKYRVCRASSNGYRRNSATEEESLESIFVET
jgi:hypothetical protein